MSAEDEMKLLKKTLDYHRRKVVGGMTWDELAGEVGLSPQGFYANLRSNDMRLSVFIKAANALGVSASQLLIELTGEPTVIGPDKGEHGTQPNASAELNELKEYIKLLETEGEVLRKLVNRFRRLAGEKENDSHGESAA
ncbi:MAG: hypothetical protein RIE59_16445 [Imperialibacter sp.]